LQPKQRLGEMDFGRSEFFPGSAARMILVETRSCAPVKTGFPNRDVTEVGRKRLKGRSIWLLRNTPYPCW